MFHGVIRTRDILRNPRIIISMHGYKGFLNLLFKCMSRKPYQFIDFIETEVTGKIYISKHKHV
jgi:hypothetical protein